ncbi:protein lethal(2)essential for life [Diachasma alloeum]|uniref:protein lethal(2)essential for life n=1 Tax=Diachasma alloeum TaxID=454923 RepID=UPI0007381614|nr:protein lethal(2)essential for life [Diachasma alloeum]
MSLLPMLFSNWWEDLERPHRLHDQHFGRVLNADDFLHDPISPLDSSLLILRAPRRRLHHFHPYEKTIARKSGGASVVQADKDKFQVNLDVQQFAPEEINVKVVGRNVVIEGKHEEKQDEHGFISRQFTRKYLVPEQCEIDELQSHLSSDGVLTITAPKKKALEDKNERTIPITQTGQPALKDVEPSSSQSKESTSTPKSPVTRGQEKAAKTVKAA